MDLAARMDRRVTIRDGRSMRYDLKFKTSTNMLA
jgi:hypothetical protein